MNSNYRRGAIFILFLLLLPILVLMVGFAVDFAHVQKVRTELRRSTDLAAKAAASALCETENLSQSRQAAKSIASLNQVNGSPLTIKDNQIVFGTSQRQPDGTYDFIPNAANPNAVQIFGRRTASSADGNVPSFFGSFYGRPAFEPECMAISAFVNSDIVLVLDRSSSMKLPTTSSEPLMNTGDARFCETPRADCRWVALDAAVNAFLAELDATSAKAPVGVVTFASDYTSCSVTSNKVTVDRSLTADTNLVRSALSTRTSQKWNGMTDIAAGIVEGQNVLSGPGSRANALKFMVVLTDGRYTADDPVPVGKTAANAGIVIYTVTFSAGADQSHMKKLAKEGNGQHFHADTPSELDSAFRELGGSLAAHSPINKSESPKTMLTPANNSRTIACGTKHRKGFRYFRLGTTTVEVALTAPLLFLMFFAGIEFSRANMLRNVAENAALEGARKGILPGATAQQCIDEARDQMAILEVSGAEVLVNPTTIKADTANVTVTVRIPLDENALPASKFVIGKWLVQSITLPRELD